MNPFWNGCITKLSFTGVALGQPILDATAALALALINSAAGGTAQFDGIVFPLTGIGVGLVPACGAAATAPGGIFVPVGNNNAGFHVTAPIKIPTLGVVEGV